MRLVILLTFDEFDNVRYTVIIFFYFCAGLLSENYTKYSNFGTSSLYIFLWDLRYFLELPIVLLY